MYKNKSKQRAWNKRYQRTREARWKNIGSCIECGVPTTINEVTNKPYLRCFKHRVRHSRNLQKWRTR